MNINPVYSRRWPRAEASSNTHRRNEYGERHIPQSRAVSGTSLAGRSAIPTKNISALELRGLIAGQRFSNTVQYRVKGDLSLESVRDLKALPNILHVEGNLTISDCPCLVALATELSVGGNLDIVDCDGLRTLSEQLSVKGDLQINHCTSLTDLPGKPSVGSFILITGCDALTDLPENFSTEADLLIRNCSGLTTLAKNLSVATLFINACPNLRDLSGIVSVKEDLTITDCRNLRTLSGSLAVRGDLAIRDCPHLMELPQNPSVGGNLDFTNCTDLTALPDWITTMGPTSSGQTRQVVLQDTGLSETLLDRLDNIDAPGIALVTFRRARQPKGMFSNLEQAFAFWQTLASSDAKIPNLHFLRPDQTTELIQFLTRLTATAEYQNFASRPLLAQRVIEVMSLLASPAWQDAMRRISDALSTCNDRIILALDDLETLKLLFCAQTLAMEKQDPHELRKLGLQMMRQEAVNKIASDHMKTLMKTLNLVDEIEVQLAFQIGVRKKIKLPGSTRHMLFRGCSLVTDQDIAKAVEQVNTHCSEGQLETYLAQWAPWQKFKRQQTVPPFDQLHSTTVRHIDNCRIIADKTDKMVVLDGIHLDYDALVRIYLEKGNHPYTNGSLDWSTVFRLIEKAPPPPRPSKKKKAKECHAVQQVGAHYSKASPEASPEDSSKAQLQNYLAEMVPWQKFKRQQNVPRFDQLHSRTVGHIENCRLTSEKTAKMVVLDNVHFDYDALVRAYLENGKNPLTNDSLDWSTVFRLNEKPGRPAKQKNKDCHPM